MTLATVTLARDTSDGVLLGLLGALVHLLPVLDRQTLGGRSSNRADRGENADTGSDCNGSADNDTQGLALGHDGLAGAVGAVSDKVGRSASLRTTLLLVDRQLVPVLALDFFERLVDGVLFLLGSLGPVLLDLSKDL